MASHRTATDSSVTKIAGETFAAHFQACRQPCRFTGSRHGDVPKIPILMAALVPAAGDHSGHQHTSDLRYKILSTRGFTSWRRRWTAPANMSSARKTSDRLESASTDGAPHQDDDVSLVGAHTSPSNHSVRSTAWHTT